MNARPALPIGELEGQRLEFKSTAALERPERIAREVVGMLNAEGGAVWIGLRDEAGRAVEIEPIPAAERARERLLDSLVDTLSPSPDHHEVKIEVVALPENGDAGLLRITVTPRPERRPYAVVSGGSYAFVTRVGARLRPMEREEIFAGAERNGSEALDLARKKLGERRAEVRAAGASVLWLGLQPAPSIRVDPQSPLFEKLAEVPAESGNREAGWTFVETLHRPEVSAAGVQWGWTELYRIEATFHADGGATFLADLAALSDGETLWPLALLEYPVSGLRIARQVYLNAGLAPSARVVAALLIQSVDEVALPYGHRHASRGRRPLPGGEASAELDFPADEFLANPDRCGFRLLRQVYQAFGIREEDMPKEFDRETGRLILPE